MELITKITNNELALKVVEQLGYEDIASNIEDIEVCLQDVVRGGGNAGWPGFTYSKDCSDFFYENKKLIINELESMASDLGEDMLKMISGFNCLKSHNLAPSEIGEIIWSNRADSEEMEMHNIIIDALCWFALEEVAMLAGY